MVESEHLDIRTVTMGICMLSCPAKDPATVGSFVFDRVVSLAGRLCRDIPLLAIAPC